MGGQNSKNNAAAPTTSKVKDLKLSTALKTGILSLKSHKLKILPPALSSNLDYGGIISALDLSFNSITENDKTLMVVLTSGKFVKLKNMNLSNNDIYNITSKLPNNNLSSLIKLETLNLSVNPLGINTRPVKGQGYKPKTLPLVVLPLLPVTLKTLILSECYLSASSITESALSYTLFDDNQPLLKNLVTLNLSSNTLGPRVYLANIGKCAPNLQILDLSNNGISLLGFTNDEDSDCEIEATIYKKLTSLNLKSNNLTTLDKRIFSLPILIDIDLSKQTPLLNKRDVLEFEGIEGYMERRVRSVKKDGSGGAGGMVSGDVCGIE